MKKLSMIVLSIVLLFVLAGSASFAEEFKVGLLVKGAINDSGFTQSGYEGLLAIEKEYNAEVSWVRTASPSDMKDSFIDYGEKGFDLVIGHGFEYQDAAFEVAPDYPDTKFATIGGSKVAENLAPFAGKSEDIAYLAGIIAAMISKTGIAGLVGGMDVPAIMKTFRGFELGAKTINPDFKVLAAYVGSWDDVNLGYETSLAHIKRGADVVYANANIVGQGVIKAAVEKDIWCYGHGTDQSNFAPDNMIASVVADFKSLYVEIARRVQAGEFKGEITEVGLKAGVANLIWNEKVKKQLPQEVLEAVNKATERIISGEITVPGEHD